ncbi:cytochrome P450 7A1 isoform X2 [Brachyhypopomus gauderio]|uniref:cytochrome P450 7A1 isoform X2 n=1 Tax=Brachyhypopomus gauderio TaxID=698409 RepID=UPI004042ACEA
MLKTHWDFCGQLSSSMEIYSRVFGHADFTSPLFSESYREVHALFQQTLQGPSLQALTQAMLSNLQAVLEQSLPTGGGWKEEGLQNFTNRVMFEAGYLTLFGKEAGLPEAERVGRAAATCLLKAERDFLAFDRSFPVLAVGVPITLCVRAWRAREALAEELVHSELHRRLCISDLIQRRMDAFDRMHLDEAGKARTHVCMLWASQANTLPAAFWSLYYTLRCPQALDAARAEVDRVLKESNQSSNGHDQPISFSKEQLESMTVLDSIIKEALRLSSASTMIRVASDDFVLTLDSGQTAFIRKGDYIALYPQLIHLDPEIYPNPMEFKYDRFLDEAGQSRTQFFKGGRPLKHYFMPFGSGSSRCPGRYFAVNEIKQFLLLVLWRCELRLANPSAAALPDHARAGLGVLPPSRDVPLRYRARGDGRARGEPVITETL